MVYIDLYGYKVMDIADVRHFHHSRDVQDPIWNKQIDYLKIFAEARNISIEDAAKEIGAAFAFFGIDKKKLAQDSSLSFIIVEKGKSDAEYLRNELFGYLGDGFEDAYNEGGALEKAIDAMFKDVCDGDIIDITNFKKYRDQLTSERTQEKLKNVDKAVIEGEGSLLEKLLYVAIYRPIVSNLVVAADSKAGDVERARAGTAAAIEIVSTAGPFVYKGSKSVLGAAVRRGATKKVPGRGYHNEVYANKPVKPQDATDKWDEFLGPGPHSNKHPRTGEVDPDRIVSADGTRSIRYGSHEMGGKPTKHHYHEETWTYDSVNNVMNVDNTVVRVPLPKKKN
jgi:hypothetical protein